MLKLQDIQIRGVNRDQNKIQKANQFPNSKHFFTYRHSLRASFRCTYAFVPVSFFYILWSSYSSCVPINICSMTEYFGPLYSILLHCARSHKGNWKNLYEDQIMKWNEWYSSVSPKYWFFCAELCINFISFAPGELWNDFTGKKDWTP